ncbi:MAG: hypothetical protein APR54_12675 [Candidatus Cloacimonas sp. SDB]|nr:MAG: hypothetical protein APR54_12675 [Candidatus Cloacimonas sp. SDB]
MGYKEKWYHNSYFRSFCFNWNNPVYKKIYDWLGSENILVDVGCGSGEFLLLSADKINLGYGLELSNQLILQSQRKLPQTLKEKIFFLQTDFLNWQQKAEIDTLTLIFVLHEIEPKLRIQVMHKALDLAKSVIVADYVTPQPFNPAGMFNYLAELLTPKDHFRNFRHFQHQHWLNSYIKENNLQVMKEEKILSGSYHLLKISQR